MNRDPLQPPLLERITDAASIGCVAIAGIGMLVAAIFSFSFLVSPLGVITHIQINHQRDLEHSIIAREIHSGTTKTEAARIFEAHGFEVLKPTLGESADRLRITARHQHGIFVACAAQVNLYFDDQGRYSHYGDAENCVGP